VIVPNQAALTQATNYLNTLPAGSAARANEQTVVNALQALPPLSPGAINLGNGTSQEVLNSNQTGTEHYIGARWDYTATSKDSVWYRLIYDHATLSEPFAANSLGLYPQTAFDHNQFHAIGWTRNVSSTIVSQAQFNFTRTVQV